MNGSLRERKKLSTRLDIYKAACKLFKKNGYNHTTLKDIAVAANISQRTIFSYFSSKEAIIFEPQREILDNLFNSLQNRESITVLEALKAYSVPEDLYNEAEENSQIVTANSELQETMSFVLSSLELRITDLIAKEYNLPDNSIQTRLITACCRAMITYSIDHKSNSDASKIAIDFIEAGLKATSS